ncbi:DUF4040 domain-containing protein [Phormidium tenue]|uniref:MrpA C-terminal/MbhD domain-containing protein n=1 Tax=Phormidium tenue NIES-30 TaxID=549789 RepID=A0A1U7IYI1_9CYAN|nr:DUF4040 domain-containing protein [Phormidium tenue]MBD2234857.1 DUF4040 domain-containing protein [Phormidium tenue FACHB-1052]OKH43784.1 hypothetical protein NIES30_24175 [Phormidium tenue NIES-30]
MANSYVYAIMLLLPLSAAMVVFQANPYQALIMRGILGAVAALIYVMLGGADVALTEALVGTMLAVTLYVVAVRSSLVMRLGVLEGEGLKPGFLGQPLLDYLRSLLKRYQLRLELVPYADQRALHQALAAKDVHGICLASAVEQPYDSDGDAPCIVLRVQRLYEIFAAELPVAIAESRLHSPGDAAPLSQPSTLREEH